MVHAFSRREGRDLAERHVDELGHLARSADLQALGHRIFAIDRIHPATYLGKGQVADLKEKIQELEAEVVVFNHALSPVQQRNLEKSLEVKVVDRTGLILEIFAARARTREGTLQVNLAMLLYQQSRLVRTWSHLERQRGGVGLRGGPGETQIEVDRRLIRDRIHRLEKQLLQVERTRTLQRRARRDVPYFTASLVGYTNAGKSTLFNRLTQAGVYEADQLFATLDPTMRGLTLPNGQRIILSDTVGFIRELPHQLIAAFRATLEEVLEADLLLHVVDLSDPECTEQHRVVMEVLEELGAGGKPMMTLYNKCDRIDEGNQAKLERHAARPQSLVISARTGQGETQLLDALQEAAGRTSQVVHLNLPAANGALLARICREGHVTDRHDQDDHILLTVSFLPAAAGRIWKSIEAHVIS
ncbi:MAG: GTPase HflX [Magnetococcales bacterium]|nr:GTPase HflX [Magnetococcales bacterium]MBF0149257.1 GTPase HflX [Magnetococcales bacterium]MBF0172790.1 GTPase HflX [Magnetococcales bacterium]MBF0348000.1 GTPase HflX [Magnetococcales bacterium]